MHLKLYSKTKLILLTWNTTIQTKKKYFEFTEWNKLKEHLTLFSLPFLPKPNTKNIG